MSAVKGFSAEYTNVEDCKRSLNYYVDKMTVLEHELSDTAQMLKRVLDDNEHNLPVDYQENLKRYLDGIAFALDIASSYISKREWRNPVPPTRI